MILHQRIGVIFIVFCSIALALNILSPNNPDFWTNVIELSVITVLFSLTVIMPQSIGGIVQISGLIVSAAIAPNSPGGPFFSVFIIIFCLVLCYAYGGYKTQTAIKVLASCAVVYCVMTFTLSKYEQPPSELFIRGISWSSFVYVFSYVLWVIFEDMDRRFHSHREKELLNLNRQLIQLNHEILDARCDDAP